MRAAARPGPPAGVAESRGRRTGAPSPAPGVDSGRRWPLSPPQACGVSPTWAGPEGADPRPSSGPRDGCWAASPRPRVVGSLGGPALLGSAQGLDNYALIPEGASALGADPARWPRGPAGGPAAAPSEQATLL